MSGAAIAWGSLFQRLGGVDPAPLFVLSLIPYLAFLWWARQVRAFPRRSLLGFRLTLLFVAVTIIAAVVAQVRFGRQLADVDPLHGGAESLLTLSNLLVLLGFRSLAEPPDPGDGRNPDAATDPPLTAR